MNFEFWINGELSKSQSQFALSKIIRIFLIFFSLKNTINLILASVNPHYEFPIKYKFTTCCEPVFFGEFNEQSLVILCVNWSKNEGSWNGSTKMNCFAEKWIKSIIKIGNILNFPSRILYTLQNLKFLIFSCEIFLW